MRTVGALCVPVALMAAACSVSSGTGPDSGPEPGEDGGGPDDDGSVGAAGLVLEFQTVPALTAVLGGDFPAELEEVRIDLENVRAVGDAAPGDSSTTRDQLRLDWRGEDDGDPAENGPVIVSFSQAPPGLYSHVLAQVKSYRLRGSVELEEGGDDRDFDIEDSPASLSISIPLGGVMLEGGETRELAIEVSVVDAVVETRWDEITPDAEGNLRITSSSPQISAIREQIAAAFEYPTGDEVSSQ